MSRKTLSFCGVLILVLIVTAVTAGYSFETRAYQMRDDFGTEPLQECILSYYYYIPCATYSWFWGFYDWHSGDIIGQFFTIGEVSTGWHTQCDSLNYHEIRTIRVLDFTGFGTVYPGLFTVEFDVYCSDELGCPVGGSLWNSGPVETHRNWNIIDITPPLCITGCCVDPGPPPSGPRILVTATHTGTEATYPEWGLDNISAPVEQGCEMHDVGCLPILYPRPAVSHYATMHSGYYGVDFAHCPPYWFQDGSDTTIDGSVYGFLELAWSILLNESGPSGTGPSTWSDIKSMYQ
jgi:hypothetical protein